MRAFLRRFVRAWRDALYFSDLERAAAGALYLIDECAGPGAFANGNRDPSGCYDEGEVIAGRIRRDLHRALQRYGADPYADSRTPWPDYAQRARDEWGTLPLCLTSRCDWCDPMDRGGAF